MKETREKFSSTIKSSRNIKELTINTNCMENLNGNKKGQVHDIRQMINLKHKAKSATIDLFIDVIYSI